MNVIKIYWIGKKQKDDYLNLENHFLKISSKFAKIEDVPIFNKEIAKKQNLGNTQEIQNSYSYIQTLTQHGTILYNGTANP